MSILNYPLHDFMATVPNCVQTNSLSQVLEMFEQTQCDRLVVLSEQQYPIGILKLQRLVPYLLTSSGCKVDLDMQQQLVAVGDLIEPIAILPASVSLEQFKLYLHSSQKQTDWALVDPRGKFLGLVDHIRLLKFLAFQATQYSHPQQLSDQFNVAPHILDALVQLLERLPWPLILQTGSGEVLTQNPAWCKHLGYLSDSQVLRHEIESLLTNALTPEILEQQNLNHGSFYPSLEGLTLNEGSTPPASAYILGDENLSLAAYNSSHPDQAVSGFSRCHLSMHSDTCVCILPWENGQERIWQFTKIPLQQSLINTDLWLLLATDITEQEHIYQELAAKNADLIQLNRLKDEFLACMSHELKTPLTAVLGLSTLLKNQALGKLNERQARYAELIHENGRHLMTVVNDILDLTRMETGQMELTLEPVKIKAVCDRAIEQIKSNLTHTNQVSTQSDYEHYFTLSIDPELNTIVADDFRLRQMLIHLLANAFKFTATGGEVGLRVNRWEDWIAFTVWDTGIGIPEHKQHLIFQKFQQLENPLTRQFEGTGLGLVLTRALARLHGGDVSFLSQEGKGSEFTLLLPPNLPCSSMDSELEAQIQPPNVCTATTVKTNPNRLMLVVEAAPRFIEELTDQLTILDYRVVIARSGTEALEKARRLQPKVIFLNPLLPLLSGWDVLTVLKSDASTCKIPTIITATLAEKEQALFAHKADGFLSLPVQQFDLQEVLARFCLPQVSPDAIPADNPVIILRLVTTDYNTSIHPNFLPPNYRVLEADNLEQAEIIARIWQPDVVILDKKLSNPLAYLQQLTKHPILAALPLVTVDVATTQVADQVAGLCVVPCLTPEADLANDALLSVLQMAAEISRQSKAVANVCVS